MSVATPEDFFGHAIHTMPSGAMAWPSLGSLALSFDRLVAKNTATSAWLRNVVRTVAPSGITQRIAPPAGSLSTTTICPAARA